MATRPVATTRTTAETTERTDPEDSGDTMREQLDAHIADPRGAVVLLAIGSKGSGKTHFCLRFLRNALEKGHIDKLFIIAPTAKFEAANSYAWAQEGKVFLFTEYFPVLTHLLLHRRDNGQEDTSRVALFVDDLAAAGGAMLHQDESFAGLVAVARHVRVNIVLAHHSVTGGAGGHGLLPPFLRQNLTHVLLTRIASRKLIEASYEEWLGLNKAWANVREFIPWFVRLTDAGAGPGTGLLVDVAGKHPGSISWSVKSWWPDCAPDVPPRPLPKPTPTPKPKPKPAAVTDPSSDSDSSDDDDREKKRSRRPGPQVALRQAVA